ncbi:hypothetical protein EV421DRAFT_1721342 [Armillaria borealis]|uniref:Reverse transcriptase zinc-binding domain-containing protein n=1 Tax=Armillaria borealis TaxID=47425 RepID=A0AA39IUA3_9AGAR|nr:hypothetical protein EV421DRAFT_1721342 [Armillaria borealis]
MKIIDCIKVSPSYLQKVYASLSRPEISIFTQLCTSHVGLNAHLFYTKTIESPNCSVCGVSETITHYLIACTKYNTQH